MSDLLYKINKNEDEDTDNADFYNKNRLDTQSMHFIFPQTIHFEKTRILSKFLMKIMFRTGIEIETISSLKPTYSLFWQKKLTHVMELVISKLSPFDMIFYTLVIHLSQIEFEYIKFKLKELDEKNSNKMRTPRENRQIHMVESLSEQHHSIQDQFKTLIFQQSIADIIQKSIFNYLKKEKNDLGLGFNQFSLSEDDLFLLTNTLKIQYDQIILAISDYYERKQSKLKRTYKEQEAYLMPKSNLLYEKIKLVSREVELLDLKHKLISQFEIIAQQKKINAQDLIIPCAKYKEELTLLENTLLTDYKDYLKNKKQLFKDNLMVTLTVENRIKLLKTFQNQLHQECDFQFMENEPMEHFELSKLSGKKEEIKKLINYKTEETDKTINDKINFDSPLETHQKWLIKNTLTLKKDCNQTIETINQSFEWIQTVCQQLSSSSLLDFDAYSIDQLLIEHFNQLKPLPSLITEYPNIIKINEKEEIYLSLN
ncbi:MAG: hypothetical protein HYX60_07845 [Legionella longbeachae]|nr:hypothetical protein [Legionella longbeachae]